MNEWMNEWASEWTTRNHRGTQIKRPPLAPLRKIAPSSPTSNRVKNQDEGRALCMTPLGFRSMLKAPLPHTRVGSMCHASWMKPGGSISRARPEPSPVLYRQVQRCLLLCLFRLLCPACNFRNARNVVRLYTSHIEDRLMLPQHPCEVQWTFSHYFPYTVW